MLLISKTNMQRKSFLFLVILFYWTAIFIIIDENTLGFLFLSSTYFLPSTCQKLSLTVNSK